MSANMDDLGGLIGEVIREVRPFEDSWGIPSLKVTGLVLRADHPTWRQHSLEVQAARPEAVRSREVVNERVFHGIAPKGFRQAKKMSEHEAHARMLGKIAQAEKLQIDIFVLREMKAGIAAILCQDLRINGESTAQRKGVTYDLSTAKGRSAFFNHSIWEFEQDGQKKELAVPMYRKGPDGAIATDEAGEPIKNDRGGWNLGDAIAQLIMDEAEDLSRFVEQQMAQSSENSGGISTGNTASGSASQSSGGD